MSLQISSTPDCPVNMYVIIVPNMILAPTIT